MHMCRDGHIEIRHADSDCEEMCPLCRTLYALDWINDQFPLLVDAAMERFQISKFVVDRK
jgi:hypothetical protein